MASNLQCRYWLHFGTILSIRGLYVTILNALCPVQHFSTHDIMCAIRYCILFLALAIVPVIARSFSRLHRNHQHNATLLTMHFNLKITHEGSCKLTSYEKLVSQRDTESKHPIRKGSFLSAHSLVANIVHIMCGAFLFDYSRTASLINDLILSLIHI